MSTANTCPILSLPVELRLHIYSFALLDNPTITIGSAELVGKHPDIIHRLYGGKRSPFSGIPQNHEPVVETGYNASLLCITNPAVIPLSSASTKLADETYEHPHTAHLSLLLVNKQIQEELSSHFKIPKNKDTSLFLQYPHGLHVCRTLTPHLLRQAKTVHIAGAYVSRTFCPARAACMGPRQPPPEALDVKLHGSVTPNSTAQLGDLIKSLFGPTPTHKLAKLEMRIYYPGDDSYSTVWGDDSSPTVIALRNINAGEVGIEVWRGRSGTGVYLTARPSEEKRRVVSTVWRKLDEGSMTEPKRGTWVVDPRWPQWEEDYEMSAGPKGDTIVTQ
ncbi:hypothetical protein LTR36_000213 [Oleoguttula mirabilis]|uniref:Uncharacterized protein n=1 Tax=Oleoguttula mirabilis TaxID=1507867 RepID=A0AAV9K153_9PEZI|nr:hypothetical protein LTR36_000213 [Oleoguttula mirabilis]